MATVLDDAIMQQMITGNLAMMKSMDQAHAKMDQEIMARQSRWADGQNFDMRNLDVVVTTQMALADLAPSSAGASTALLTPSVAQHPALPVPFGWPTAAAPQAVAAPKAAGT